jgi:hypothetical protein
LSHPLLAWALAWTALTLSPAAAFLTSAQIDRYAICAGTQTFGPVYSFTSTNVLIETALAMRGMGKPTATLC